MNVTLADAKLINDLLVKIEKLEALLSVAASKPTPEIPMTQAAAQKAYGIKKSTFDAHRRSGLIKSYKLGNTVYVFPSDMNEAIRRNKYQYESNAD